MKLLSIRTIQKTLFSVFLICCGHGVAADNSQQSAELLKLPEIAAAYITSVESDGDSKVEEWNFWRYQNYVETQYQGGLIGEIWELGKRGLVTYRWLHHDEKFAVQHEPSPSVTPQGVSLWDVRATIFDEGQLSLLQKKQTTQLLGYQAESYEGKIGDDDVKITWLPELSLPGRIELLVDGSLTTIVLQEIYEFESATFQPANSNYYEEIDYEEFAENPEHPMVQYYMLMLMDSPRAPNNLDIHQH